MTNVLLLLFLSSHLIADFYCQSYKMSENKDKHFSYLLLHSLIYVCVNIIFLIPIWNVDLIVYGLLASLTHFTIDLIKFALHMNESKFNTLQEWLDSNKGWIFIVDQMLHIATIIVISLLITNQINNVSFTTVIVDISKALKVDTKNILRWFCLLLIIVKPTNIAFSRIFGIFRPVNKDSEEDGHKNAGAAIGNLERLIIIILLSQNQFAAIGLILTAKSVARYDKITKDAKFGEYFLLGTLTSLAFSIISYNFLFGYLK